MHNAMLRAGQKDAAKALLKKHFKMIDFMEVMKTIEEDETVDEDFFEIF